jgi:hypothetical protein
MPTMLSGLQVAVAALALLSAPQQAAADCLANPTLNADFETLNGGVSIPIEGSCCMFDVCGLACPVEVSKPIYGTYTCIFCGVMSCGVLCCALSI